MTTKKCQFCSKYYYPPSCPEGTIVNCKKGHHLPLCGICKKIKRKEDTQKRIRLTKIGRTFMKYPTRKEIILQELRKGPLNVDNSICDPNTIRSHISYLRSIGYSIRTQQTYILMSEP